MKRLAKLLCIVILLAIPAVVLAQRSSGDIFYYDDAESLTGTIIATDKKDKTIEIYDNSHRHFTVLTAQARIYEGDKTRSLNDLRSGDRILIRGRENGRSIIDAVTIQRLGNEGSYGKYLGSVMIEGTVRSTDKKDKKIELTVDGKTQKVRTTDDTDIISASGRRIDLDELRKGDYVGVQAYRSKNNEIVAEVIRAGRGSFDRQTVGWGESIEGRVVRKTSIFDRKLRIELTGWNQRRETMEINVPKDVIVVRYGRTISVHDIDTGEMVYVQGRWSRDSFVPTRLEVGGRTGSRDAYYDRGSLGYRYTAGEIREIDYRKKEFVVETGRERIKVYCDRAKVVVGGRERDFEHLKRGDDVRIQGRNDGKSIDAERIEIGGTGGWWLNDRD